MPRKSVNYDNILMLRNKAIVINQNEIKREKSKDDNSSIKYNMNKSDVILEEEDIATPKFKKKEEKRKKNLQKGRRQKK